jgi:DHA1 family bicyclomycin/chloramphenicol resistance-like MFS transporter
MAQRTQGLTVLVAAVSTLGPYTIDSFFPSLRAIGADLHVTTLQAQQILTAFMLPYAFMSLVHGALSDALGRRRVILVSLGLYVLASLGCTFAPGFGTLLLFRALQGMVAGAGSIIGRAVVRDCYHGVQAQRVMSTITMMFALGPAFAPIIGGWVHVWLGWRAVFGTMALFGLLVLVVAWFRLPETHPPEQRTRLHLGALVGSVARVMADRRFQWMIASSVLCFISLHAYIGSAPAIVLDHWHLSETQFGMLTIPVIAGYSLGAYITGKTAGHIEPERVIRWGYNGTLLISALMLALQFGMAHPPVLAQQLLLAATAAMVQFIFPVVTLRILDLFPEARGTASSAQAFFSMIMSAMMMGVVAPWLSVSMQRMASCCMAMTVIGWLLWFLKVRQPLRQAAGTHGR